MRSWLRLLFPILVVLLFAGSCLASSVPLTSSSVGADNDYAYTYLSHNGSSRAQTALIWELDSDSIGFGNTAADPAVIHEALDSTGEYGPRFYCRGGGGDGWGFGWGWGKAPAPWRPYDPSTTPSAVPETSTLLMVASGFATLAGLLRGGLLRRRTA